MRFSYRSQQIVDARRHGVRSGHKVIALLLALCLMSPTLALGQSEPSGEEDAPATYGPVSAVDTMWRIASENRPDPGITVHQYMLALLERNPEAFHEDNVNLLREGVVLDLPDAEAARAVSPAEASRRIDEQMRWYEALTRDEIDAIAGDAPEPTPQAADSPTEPPAEDAVAEPPAEAPIEASRITEPSEVPEGSEGRVETGPVDPAEIPDLELDIVEVRPGADPDEEETAAAPAAQAPDRADETATPQPPVATVEPLPEGLFERLATPVEEPQDAVTPVAVESPASPGETAPAEPVRSALSKPAWLVAAVVTILLLLAVWLWRRLRGPETRPSDGAEAATEREREPGRQDDAAPASATAALGGAQALETAGSDSPSPHRSDPENREAGASEPTASRDDWSGFDAELLTTPGPEPSRDRPASANLDDPRDTGEPPETGPPGPGEPQRSVVDDFFASYAEEELHADAPAPEISETPGPAVDPTTEKGEQPVESLDSVEPGPDDRPGSFESPADHDGAGAAAEEAAAEEEEVDLSEWVAPADEAAPAHSEPTSPETDLSAGDDGQEPAGISSLGLDLDAPEAGAEEFAEPAPAEPDRAPDPDPVRDPVKDPMASDADADARGDHRSDEASTRERDAPHLALETPGETPGESLGETLGETSGEAPGADPEQSGSEQPIPPTVEPVEDAPAAKADANAPDDDAPVLDDADVVVMLELAEITARDGDTAYARSLLEEIMRDGSEAMAERARALQSGLDS